MELGPVGLAVVAGVVSLAEEDGLEPVGAAMGAETVAELAAGKPVPIQPLVQQKPADLAHRRQLRN